MVRDGITVKQISPHVGAEIGNVDLTRTLTNHEVDQIHDAIIAHGVIFFREQNITPADHERFIKYFGEPHVHVGGKNTASQAVPGFPALNKQAFNKDSPRVSGRCVRHFILA